MRFIQIDEDASLIRKPYKHPSRLEGGFHHQLYHYHIFRDDTVLERQLSQRVRLLQESCELQEHVLENGESKPSVRSANRYQRLISHRWQQIDIESPFLSQAQYDDFLKCYLTTYGETRRPCRAPLSSQDVQHLNTLLGSQAELRAENIFNERFQLDNDPYQKAFLWCAYATPSLGIEDFAITAHHRRLIGEFSPHEEFPLNTFISIFLAKNPLLSKLESKTLDQRAFIYFVMMLFTLEAPQLLQFIPETGTQQLLSRRLDTGESLFQEYCQTVFNAIEKLLMRNRGKI